MTENKKPVLENKVIVECIGCGKLKMNENSWISEENQPKIYNEIKKYFGKNISHGYCKTCKEKDEEEIEKQHYQESAPLW